MFWFFTMHNILGLHCGLQLKIFTFKTQSIQPNTPYNMVWKTRVLVLISWAKEKSMRWPGRYSVYSPLETFMLFPSWVHWQQATVLFPCCQSRLCPHYVTPTHTIKQNWSNCREKDLLGVRWTSKSCSNVTWVHLKASSNTTAQQRTRSIMRYFEIFSFYLLTYLLTYLSHQDLKLIFAIFLQLGKKDKINGKIVPVITVGVQFTEVLGASTPTGWRRLPLVWEHSNALLPFWCF